jgi:ABC-2 type transport system ATP-binding protein
MSEILQLTNVWKAYDEVQALSGLDLEAKRGEIFGLVGPNGAGKTTCIKIIVGLLKMDKGIINVNGLDPAQSPYEYKRSIGYMPESVSLPDYLTVEELLIYSGKIRNIPNELIRQRIDTYLRIFDLEEKRKSLVLLLSRGMKQKAAMASALMNDPDLFILDEPLIGIDPAGQHIIKELLNARIKENKTIFLSTHMLDTAERMCNRVAIIHKGRNVATGNLRQLRSLSETGENATLEEVFLKLTEETEPALSSEKSEEQTKKIRHVIFGAFRRIKR